MEKSLSTPKVTLPIYAEDHTFLLPEKSAVKSPLEDKLNFGSVLLGKGNASCPSVQRIKQAGLPEQYAIRTVIVSEWVFAHLVNDNMEVRTSVVINPETGAVYVAPRKADW